jgi:hypothetical protein
MFIVSKLEDDRKKNRAKDLSDYWKAIPGANLYVSYDKTVTLNLRYELPDEDLLERLTKILQTVGMSNAIIATTKPDVESSKSPAPE